MVKNIVAKVMWVGRATVFLVGLTVILAVVLGVATTAVAHQGSAGLFHLGHNNPVTALSKMTGSVANGVLQVTNQSTDTTTQAATAITAANNSNGSPTIRASNNRGSPAMELNVACQSLLACTRGAPMTVNSRTKVDLLNADLLDGQDSTDFVTQQDAGQFWTGAAYSFSRFIQGNSLSHESYPYTSAILSCDVEDQVLNGGYTFEGTARGYEVAHATSGGSSGRTWNYHFAWNDTNGQPDKVWVNVTCADFPPLRP